MVVEDWKLLFILFVWFWLLFFLFQDTSLKDEYSIGVKNQCVLSEVLEFATKKQTWFKAM
jgi:hypothetical protein